MKLKDISRTATFAWDQSSSSSPLIATGAVAGALDESFSNESQLEIWAPEFGDGQSSHLGGQNSHPKGSVTVNSRFNRLAWSTPSSTHARGVLAAGMETGEINVFDPEKIINGATVEEARIFTHQKHSGPVRGLDFNPIQKNLMLSGGVNAELYIYDLNNPTNPIPPGTLSTKLNEITSLQWNPTVSRIFAASSSSGFTSVWDLRTQKEIASLQYGGGAAKGMGQVGGMAGLQMGKRRGMSDVAWHPEQATQLITASEDDESPIIMLWDLRNTRAPERILSGHHKGVLSVSWCKQDSDLLLSTGKDNRTLVWNPQSGEIIGELPPSSDWSFQTSWCPRNPDLLATASFDGHIGIHSLQTTQTPEQPVQQFSETATADDIFAGLGNQPATDSAADVLSLKQPPKWLRRPVSATFGFGGLLASTSNLPGANGKHQSGVVHLRHVVTEKAIIERAQALDAKDKVKLEEYCSEKAEKDAAWRSLYSLFKADSKDQLIELLGFSKEEVARQVSEAIKKFPSAQVEDEVEGPAPPKVDTSFNDKPETPDQDADFFSSMAAGTLRNPLLDKIPHEPQSASVAATIGSSASSVRDEPIKDNQFNIYPEGEGEVDKLITQALVLGDFASAVELCLASERFADALLLAVRGGPDLLQSTQKAYFARRTTTLPFLRVFQSIVTEDLADIVQNADLAEWKVIFVVICTYAKETEFNNLAEQLGQRLHYKSQTSKDSAKQARQDATLCFLAARRLEKVVGIWVEEMKEEEQSSSETKYTAHAQALQSFIEKVSVFTAATGYVDNDLNIPTESVAAAEAGARMYKLASLYDRYYEYADLLATQGLVDIASKFVQKTPNDYKGTGVAGNELDKARDRLLRAADFTAPAKATTARKSVAQAYQPQKPSIPAQPVQSRPVPPAQPMQVPSYTAPAYQPNPSQSAYSTPAYQPSTSQPYASNYQPPSSSPYAPSGSYGAPEPQTQSYGNFQAPQTLAPPPRAGPTSNAPPLIPASQRRDMPGWNDAPDFVAPKRPSSAARETPKPAPIMSPFPQSQMEPTYAPNIHGNTPPPPRAAQPGMLPPPPKGGPRPPSAQSLVNQIRPPPAAPAAPPSGPPAGPPAGSAPPQVIAPPPSGPPRGPPRAGPPPGVLAGPPPRVLSPLNPQAGQPAQAFAPPRRESSQAIPPIRSPSPKPAPPPAAPAKPTHPSGDRSHLPESSKPIFDIFFQELQRVKQANLPPAVKRIADDTDRRLNILFDQLNNDAIPQDVLGQLGNIARAIAKKDSAGALQLHVGLLTSATGEMTAWVPGVKQLIRLGA